MNKRLEALSEEFIEQYFKYTRNTISDSTVRGVFFAVYKAAIADAASFLLKESGICKCDNSDPDMPEACLACRTFQDLEYILPLEVQALAADDSEKETE